MTTAHEYKNKFDMISHPEGGHYKETYRSEDQIDFKFGKRSISTGIYFLLEQNEKSNFHVIKSDEMWHHYDGGCLEIHELTPDGNHKVTLLGKDLKNGEVPQYTVKAGNIFGSRPHNSSLFCFVGCTVAPGFDFDDFKLFNRLELIENYQMHENIISDLTVE